MPASNIAAPTRTPTFILAAFPSHEIISKWTRFVQTLHGKNVNLEFGMRLCATICIAYDQQTKIATDFSIQFRIRIYSIIGLTNSNFSLDSSLTYGKIDKCCPFWRMRIAHISVPSNLIKLMVYIVPILVKRNHIERKSRKIVVNLCGFLQISQR